MRALLIVFVSLVGAPLHAETVPIVTAFYQCVRNSAASQMVALSRARQPRDGNAIAENAFLACTTEQEAIRDVAASAGISGLETNMLLTKHKIALKQEIVAANPSPLSRR
jgi:hypothetical protein